MKKFLLGTALGVGLTASGASASTLNGEFWNVAANTIANVTQAIDEVNGGADPVTATFTSTSIAYGDSASNFPIGSLSDFLNADSGSIVGTNSANIQESVFRLTGNVSLTDGDIINVTSDDGFRLIIGGNTINPVGAEGLRGPGSSTNMVWNGGTGTFGAILWYFEGNVTQAQLESNLGSFVAPVPLPASALLLMGGLAGLGMMRRRRKS